MRARAKYTSGREAKHIADRYVEDPKKPKKKIVKRSSKPKTASPTDAETDDSEPQSVEELLRQRAKGQAKKELEEFLERERQEQMPLTDKMLIFCQEYIVDRNKTQAAIRAGYSKKTAGIMGHKLFKKANIQKTIKVLLEEHCKRVGFDADRVLNYLADQLTADVNDLYDDNGHIKDVSDWPMTFRQGLVKKITTKHEFETVDDVRKAVGRITQVELHDRKQAIQLIGRHIGIQAFANPNTRPDTVPVNAPIADMRNEMTGTGLRISPPPADLDNTPDPATPKVIDGKAKARLKPRGKVIEG